MNKAFLIVVLFGIVQLIAAEAPIPGLAGYALELIGEQNSPYGEVGGSTIVDVLGGSWTFELWAKIENPKSGSKFQPIISHYTAGNLHNRNAGFNLQVWPNGQVCFFMGNGVDTNGGYGILIYGTQAQQALEANTWYHFAVTFNGADIYPYTPDRASVYVDGELLGSVVWNEPQSSGFVAGRRNIPNSRFHIGRFDNQDPDVQTVAGAVDELRFWSTERSVVDILTNAYRRVALNSADLVSYYRFEDQSAQLTDDLNNYNGLIRFTAGGPQVPIYVPSEAQVFAFYEVEQTKTVIVDLTSVNVDGKPVTYFIAELPEHGKLYVVSSLGSVGVEIKASALSVALPSNKVAYVAGESFLGFDSFHYIAKDAEAISDLVATVFVEVTENTDVPNPNPTPSCDGVEGHVYDECGICNGNGESCRCVADQYRNYSLIELDRILVHYNIQYTLDLIGALDQTLDDTLAALYTRPATVQLGDAVEVIQTFNEQCLTGFVEDMNTFLSELRQVA